MKSLGNMDIHQISNLAKLTAYLVTRADIPLHFLKIIDFNPDNEKDLLNIN